jgi:hypothetical protein
MMWFAKGKKKRHRENQSGPDRAIVPSCSNLSRCDLETNELDSTVGATADLDSFSARRRQHPAVEARESLLRGQTREMTLERRKSCQIDNFGLAFAVAIREQRN